MSLQIVGSCALVISMSVLSKPLGSFLNKNNEIYEFPRKI